MLFQLDIFLFYRAIKQVCAETKPSGRSKTNMELQEINDKLKALTAEIKDLEGNSDAILFMEKLLQEQEKLIETVCFICVIFS